MPRPKVLSSDIVSMRVLVSKQDFAILRERAQAERSDISTIVRRLLTKAGYFVPSNGNVVTDRK